MGASSPDVMMRVLVFEPTGRHGYRTVTRQDRLDLFHVGATDLPAERAEICRHLAGARKPTSAVLTTGLLRVHRKANCGRVLPYLAASGRNSSTAARLRWKCSGPNSVRNRFRLPRLPLFERQSLSSKDIPAWNVPLSMP